MHKIKLRCPYCDQSFSVDSPTESDYIKKPSEVYCLPYTRDIGKFDPKPEIDILSSECWSKKIGKDYLSFINFERVGILRVEQKGINVKYRVQKCVSCGSLFDVFANYTYGKSLQQIWPHLFSGAQTAKEFKLYKGENLIIKLINSLDKFTNSVYISAILLGVVIFILGWLPYYFLSESGKLNFRLAPAVVSLLGSGSLSLVVQEMGLNQPSSVLLLSTFFLYLIISIGIVVLLIQFEKYLSYLRMSTDFDGLFRLINPKVGLVFWKNYISSRFVGVQDEKASIPRINQSDVFAGGLSLILAISSWLYFQSKDNEFWRCLVNRDYDLVLFFLIEIIVWLIIIYFLSIAIYLALSLTSYVLSGVRKIPMNLTPFDNFQSSKPLKNLEAYAVNIMLVTFIVILFALSILQLIVPIQWVIGWFELALALLFIAVGLGSNRGEYLVGALFYLLILFSLNGATFTIDSYGFSVLRGIVSISSPVLIIDLRIIALGVFFTSAMAFQLLLADHYINDLLISSKNLAIKIHKEQLELMEENLAVLNKRIEKLEINSSQDLLQNFQSQRYSVLSSIEATLRIIGHLEKVEVFKNPFLKITKTFTPLATSFVLPILLNVITAFLTQPFTS